MYSKTAAKTATFGEALSDKYALDFSWLDGCWETHHVESLLKRLYASFLKCHTKDRERREVAGYGHHFLGTVVLSPGYTRSGLPDGELTLVTLTLLLIYLTRLADGRDDCPTSRARELVFSERFSESSLNLDLDAYQPDLEALFEGRERELAEGGSGSPTLLARYRDIEAAFPDELKADALPYFMDWLMDSVELQIVVAMSDEEARAISARINDRDSRRQAWRELDRAAV